MPLRLRRVRALISAARRKCDNLSFIQTRQLEMVDSLKNRWRLSFQRRLNLICENMGLKVEELICIPAKSVHKLVVALWRKELIESTSSLNRELNSNYKNLRTKYSQVFSSRRAASIWHASRCRTLPLNGFLFKIRKTKSQICRPCKRVESVEHFILECPLYRIRERYLSKSTSRAGLGSIFNVDTPPPAKRRLVGIVSRSLKRRLTPLPSVLLKRRK